MSSLINKVKSSMHKDSEPHSATGYSEPRGTQVSNDTYGTPSHGISGYGNQSANYDNPRSTNAGPHNSNVMNKADPRVDSDLDRTRNTGYENPPSTNAGPHNSNTMNKADPRVDSDLDRTRNTGYENPRSTNAGPHNSNTMNKADPRVDSDVDRIRNTGYGNTAGTSGVAGSGTTGDYETRGSTNHGVSNQREPHTSSGISSRDAQTQGPGYGSSNAGSTNAGPHNSNLMNKIDPRVNSNQDGRGVGQGIPAISSTGDHTTHQSGRGTMEHDTRHTGAGYGSSNIENATGTAVDDNMTHSTRHTGGGTYDSSATYRSGPDHLDSSRTHHSGPGTHESSTTQSHNGTGNISSTTHTSTHTTSSAYPNDDSENRTSGVTPGLGKAQQTTGPHKSTFLNKLDPRVDSDLAGSKTSGGNVTY